jgi:hypothetical protein
MITLNFTKQILAEKQRKTLNKPFRTPNGPKKFGVYVKNEKGNVVLVRFGDPNMEIKRDDPKRRKSFRARHNCSNPGPKYKARYWSCYQWRAGSPVKGSEIDMEVEAGKGLWYNIQKKKEKMGKNYKAAKPGDKDYPSKDALKKAQGEDWDGETLWKQEDLLKSNPSLVDAEEVVETECECQKESRCGCQNTQADYNEDEKEDHEASMAKGQLRKISSQAGVLSKAIPDDAELMAWAQDKISKAEHFVEAVHDYMVYNDSALAGHDLSDYSFNNPGQAMKKAKEMGFDDIHTHGEGDDAVFMPGATHKELLKKLDDSKAYYGMKKKKK